MAGSDIVLLEWNGAVLQQSDRHALGTYEPIVDSCPSNWLLSKYETTSNVLYIELKRELNTTDTQDRPVIPGEMRVIAAYGDTRKVSYHGANRHTTSVTFIPSNVTSPVLEGT